MSGPGHGRPNPCPAAKRRGTRDVGTAAVAAVLAVSAWASPGRADDLAALSRARLDDRRALRDLPPRNQPSHLRRAQSSAQPSPTTEIWSVYRNDRYGFRLEYPSSLFLPESPPTNNNGRSFRTSDGRARLIAYASMNHEGKSLDEIRSEYLESAGNLVVTYNRIVGRGIVISGESGNDIVYTRIILSAGADVINVVEITYPTEWKELFDPIVTRISRSFRAGEMRR